MMESKAREPQMRVRMMGGCGLKTTARIIRSRLAGIHGRFMRLTAQVHAARPCCAHERCHPYPHPPDRLALVGACAAVCQRCAGMGADDPCVLCAIAGGGRAAARAGAAPRGATVSAAPEGR